MKDLGVNCRGIKGLGQPAGISHPRFSHALRWKQRHCSSHCGSPPHVGFPPTSITLDLAERVQEATFFLLLVAVGSVRPWKAPQLPRTPMIGPMGGPDPSGVEKM